MFGIAISREGKPDPVSKWEIISILNFSSFGWSIQLIVVDAGFLVASEPHGQKLFVRT